MKSKTTTVFLLFLVLFTSTFASNKEALVIESKVEAVTIYLDGAEITRTASAKLEKGTHKIVVEGLSPYVLENSVQVSGSSSARILSVLFEDYEHEFKGDANYLLLRDSIELFKDRLTGLKDELDAYEQEKALLLANQKLVGQHDNLTMNELKEAADFYRQRILEVNKLISDNKRRTREATKVNQGLYKRSELPAPEDKLKAIVQVKVLQSGTTDFTLRYLVRGTAWTPTYTLRAESIEEDIKLDYQAVVFNNTETDWGNIPLKLSTANPTVDASRPQLNAWVLNYERIHGGEGGLKDYKMEKEKTAEYDDYVEEIEAEPVPPSDNMTMQVNELNAEFVTEDAYHILADGSPHVIDLLSYDLKASFIHYSIPKIKQKVYLVAQIHDWQDLELLDGPMNLYYQNTYIGKSSINTAVVEDTLDLSLGIDQQIDIFRSKLKNKSGKKFLGSNVREEFVYEIVVKNNQKEAVDLEIIDQLPISNEKDIQIIVNELSGAKRDELSGKLTWEFSLAPKQEKKLLLGFTVKYPKGKQLQINRNMRQIRTPRYFHP